MRSFKEYWNEHGDAYAMEIAEDAWDYQQSKIDELNCDINVQKEQLNKLDRVIDGYAIEVDELERIIELRDQQLTDEIALSTKYVSKFDELQKRVDFILKVVQSMRNEVKHGHLSEDESQTLSSYADDLEQALKGG